MSKTNVATNLSVADRMRCCQSKPTNGSINKRKTESETKREKKKSLTDSSARRRCDTFYDFRFGLRRFECDFSTNIQIVFYKNNNKRSNRSRRRLRSNRSATSDKSNTLLKNTVTICCCHTRFGNACGRKSTSATNEQTTKYIEQYHIYTYIYRQT